ncbi:MAG: acylphosphatase [Deltaproteobacteria bacterium]|nr:acylphosphatase [Deltaproteobacteria bacterium]MBW2356806.1 acylphosphatase [Deltaproteobacteria bacterium]RLB98118.1 MAG: acylphosphatase [Deltaproteobacteria bacterium]
MADLIARHLLIAGRVQGVFFRLETQRAAARLGASGWVRNLPDGTVEALVEGERPVVEALIDWCRRGPARARVDDVRIADRPYQGRLKGFEIRH